MELATAHLEVLMADDHLVVAHGIQKNARKPCEANESSAHR